jgi:hypothetical protein
MVLHEIASSARRAKFGDCLTMAAPRKRLKRRQKDELVMRVLSKHCQRTTVECSATLRSQPLCDGTEKRGGEVEIGYGQTADCDAQCSRDENENAS